MLTVEETPLSFSQIGAVSRALKDDLAIQIASPIEKSYWTIIEDVCHILGVSESEVLGKSRVREIVHARMIIQFKMLSLPNATLCKVAKVFNRHHSTVIHARLTINDLTSKNDPELYKKFFLCDHV